MERWPDARPMGPACEGLLHTRMAKHCGQRYNRRRRSQACENAYPPIPRSSDEVDQSNSFGGDN